MPFSSLAFSPSASQILMTVCRHKQDMGDAEAQTEPKALYTPETLKRALFLVTTYNLAV